MKNYKEDGRTLNGENADMLRNMPCGVVALRLQKKSKTELLYYSDSFAGLCDLTSDELDKIYKENGYAGIHPEDSEKIKDYFFDHKEEASFALPAFRLRSRDGYIWIKAKVKRKQDDKEDAVYYVACMNAEEEQEWKTALEEAEKANQVKRDFLSLISHEIRTPINTIIGVSELSRQNLLGSTPDLALSLEYIQQLKDAAAYLLTLVNDILDMSKIENGEVTLRMEPVDSERYLRDINALIRPLAEEKGIRYCFKRLTNFHKTYIGDGTRVQQILLNLLNNGVKFTPPGGEVSMTAEVVEQDEKQATLKFVISDNGIGISEAFQGSMFGTIPQESRSPGAPREGTGLGLTISKQLAEMMGGSIRVESEPGRGTTFSVFLKAGISNEDVISVKRQPEETPKWNFNGVRILMCEDHPVNRMVAVRLMENTGCRVDTAVNGRSGADMFFMSRPGSYDLILMDIRMPMMDGLEAAKKIRSMDREDAKTVPIIALSANAYVEDIQKSLEAGMNLHLAKPIEPEKLYQLIYTCIKKKEF
ncbi:MAG: ATP-binding protein [Lachnospiraceae bacterium]|nr:ATP-binding protein [Lachnospiraceae bacterium]